MPCRKCSLHGARDDIRARSAYKDILVELNHLFDALWYYGTYLLVILVEGLYLAFLNTLLLP